MADILLSVAGTTVGLVSLVLTIVQLRISKGVSRRKHRETTIVVESRRRRRVTIERDYPGATIIDVTSNASMPWARLCPSFPHGNISIPYTQGTYAASVESLWEGLKVFVDSDIDICVICRASMDRCKREENRFGKYLGHRRGVNGSILLDEAAARLQIYLPTYRWVLEKLAIEELAELRKFAQLGPVVLLDDSTNLNLSDITKPISHAFLIKCFLEGEWPSYNLPK